MSVTGPKLEQRFYGYKHWTLEEHPRCFNVGKGLQGRPYQKRGRNHKWHAIVKRYGLRVEVCVGPLEHFDACAWEIEQIAAMGTFSTNHSHDNLNDIGCNFTRGGEGGFGRVRSDQERLEHSLRAKKQWAENHEIMVVSLKEAWANSSETRREASRRTLHSSEAKAKHAKAMADPQIKAKRSASARAFWRDNPDALAKRTESIRKYWANLKQERGN
jgi:hypothetical protein